MSVYVVGLSKIHNLEGMGRYRQGVPGTLAQYRGRLAIRGVVDDVLEGTVGPDSVVVFEFESVEDARRWHNSSEYRGVREHRLGSADSTLLLISAPPDGASTRNGIPRT